MRLALSVRQPWAWLIVSGFKDVENRTWETRYRGDLLIHAGKAAPSEAELCEIEREFGVTIPRDLLEFGGIIGCARLVDCVSRHKSRWFEGPFGFVLAGARPLHFRPWRGQLGFFQVAE